MTGEIIRTVLALAVVVGLVFASRRLLKKRQASGGFMMNVVGYCPLGTRKGIAACRVGREVLLIGVTQNDIKLIKSYKDEELDEKTIENIRQNIQRIKSMKESLRS
jgi:flagellar biogenesis protein FliO